MLTKCFILKDFILPMADQIWRVLQEAVGAFRETPLQQKPARANYERAGGR